MQRVDQRRIELQQRLAASADDILWRGVARAHPALSPMGEGIEFQHSATACANASASLNTPPPGPSVPTKSVSQNWQVALARSRSKSRPQIAARKAQEHRRAPGLRALALQRVVNFFDGIRHRAAILLIALGAQIAGRAFAAAIAPVMAMRAVAFVAGDGFFDDQIDQRLPAEPFGKPPCLAPCRSTSAACASRIAHPCRD